MVNRTHHRFNVFLYRLGHAELLLWSS
jgi:hypothetical protein